MHEAATIPTLTSDTSENLTAAARQAESWFGEPFLAPDEDPLQALAPGTARRAALDDALAEIESGLKAPSSRWKVRYGLMLGLERVLTEDPARTASGTELRRHQIDALTGMLAELIAATQRPADENGNGHASTNGTAAVADADLDEEADDDYDAGYIDDDEALEAEFTGADPGAIRRFRFRHPTASGKTIAAAGFVESARHLGILILTHRRLLVSQFLKGSLEYWDYQALTDYDLDRKNNVSLFVFGAFDFCEELCSDPQEVNRGLGTGETGVEFHRVLEALNGLRILRAGERLHALVQLIARLELVAAHAKDRQRGDSEDQHYLAHNYCPASTFAVIRPTLSMPAP
jgi:hypothetical protein